MVIFLILLLTPSLALTHCNCAQLLSQSDCQSSKDYNCEWVNNICQINSNTPVVITDTTYCSQQTVCSSTKGCAYLDSKCIPFSGCSAYVYTTKEECQNVSTLCISNGVHCVELSTCSSYKTQTACSQNKNGNYCFWNDDACIDPVECTQLPSTLDSDQKCRNELSKCTVAESGKGCVESGTLCADQKYQAACVYNKAMMGLCYWTTDNNCVDRYCPAAPTTYTTDEQCSSFLITCTTKANGGCVTLSLCSAATIQAACVRSVTGSSCYWAETICIEKQCNKAPNTYTTDKQCKQIDQSCITNGGGCLTQTGCTSATVESGCVDMSDGTQCFWTGSECKIKICQNAPHITTNDQCTSFMSTCTLNSTSNGCVEKTCETSLTQTDCTSKCLWMSQCYEKKCSLASKTFTTFNDCNGYLNTCTVANVGYGCMIMGLSCSAYSSQASCTQLQSGAYCGWDGNTCVDRQCSMAPSTITTASDCSAYKPNCILTNSGSGCMDIPSTCSARNLQTNCEYGTNPACVWINSCLQKSCETATLTTVNSSACSGYLSGCIINNSGDGCRSLPATCNLLSVINCQTAQSGDCFWSGGQCKEFICTNIIQTNHSDCNNTLNKCTVNSNGTACMNISSRCSQYSQQSQCYQSNIGLCYWTGQYCVDFDCVNATDTSSYSTHQQCQDINSKCTVVNKVNQSGCVSKLSNCSDYKYQYQCVQTLNLVDCIWNNNRCFDKSLFTCGNIQISTYTNANCESVLFSCKANISSNGCTSKICTDYTYTAQAQCEAVVNCTVNKAGTGCVTKQQACSQYTTLSECKYSNEGECKDNGTACYYINALCSSFSSPSDDSTCSTYRPFCTMASATATACSNRTCNSYSGTINYANCQAYDSSCAPLTDSSACYAMTTLCYGILNPDTKNDQNHCTYSLNEGKCVWNSNTQLCVPFGVATQQNCYLSTTIQATVDYNACQNLSSFCSVNRAGTQCVNLKPQCSDYSQLTDCVQSTSSLCIQSQQTDTGSTCMNIPQSIQCNKLYRGSSFVYTSAECSKMKSNCTNNGTTGCQDKTCSVSLTSHAACEQWLNTCTVNASNTQCTSKPSTCLEQSTSSCLYAIEGACAVIDGRCRKMICENATSSFNTDAQCNNYLNTCTVARIGGCMTKLSACSNYVTQINCKQNYSGQECFWNPSDEKCVDSKCELIEQSNNFDTHDKCYNALKCTVSTTGMGCTSLNSCTNYVNQSQCVIDGESKLCSWNTTCKYKSCDTAPTLYTTHLDCQTYFNCTLKIGGGCQELSSCVEYLSESQCIIDDKGKDCGWATDHCIIKSCVTAPITVTSNDACENYLSGCMVASSGQGCVDKPKTCEEIQNENQCVLPCYWNANQCITKSCDNAPSDISTSLQCNEWLSQCTADDLLKCKTITCDHYTLKTDAECKAAMSTCTTDGTQCVERGTCAQALGVLGCTTSINNEQCYWVDSYCTIKVCPVITSQKDCTTASDGTKCVWDDNKCRNIGQCKDYSGTSTSQCQAINPLCMAGQNSQCADLIYCSKFTLKSDCLIGLDGPCLWISNKCYQYTSCESLSWTKDDQCKQISSSCTTNGTQCVSITSCSETNTNGGCVTGIDGECMQTVSSLQSTDSPVCKLFTSCNDAYYLTHKQCQNANKQCTTNGLTSCMALASCTSYSRMESCVIDDLGIQYQDSSIISTGICVWDGTQCSNQGCQNLSGITNEQCQSQLSTCTTDGSTCILKLSCSQYKQSVCSVGYGTEGKCNWIDTTGTCEVLICSTIDEGTTLAACQSKLSNCISDGTACIEKDQCSRYLTKAACNTGGTDGICVWNLTSKSCSLMTSCTQADNDQNACSQAIDRCSYSYATNSASSSCSTHTCDTYLKSNGLCQSFYNWNKSSKTFCSLDVNKCTTTDLTTQDSSTCFSISEYTYTWNTSTNKCQSCLQSTSNSTSTSNNTTANTNSTPTTTVQYGQNLLLGILIILI